MSPAAAAPLRRLPPLATTGVGSLPFDAPEAAVRHAVRAYDVPFVPQLPRHERLSPGGRWLGAHWAARGVECGWSAERDRTRPVAWEAALALLSAERSSAGTADGARPAADPGPGAPGLRSAGLRAGVVKLQTTGPVTLALALERAGGGLPRADAVLVLAREVAAWLAANVAEQADALRALGLDVLLVVDEPGLAAAGLPASAAIVWDPLRGAGAAWGLHVCCRVPWPLVAAARPDVVSFDVARDGVDAEAAAALADLVARGGRIAWGALDASGDVAARTVAARVLAAAGAVGAALDRPTLRGASGATVGLGAARGGSAALPTTATPGPDVVLAASLLTPACGTGRLSVAAERRAAATLAAARELVRASRPAGGGGTVGEESIHPRSQGQGTPVQARATPPPAASRRIESGTDAQR